MGESKTRLKHPPLVMPVCIVGAEVDGRPNFEAIAWFNLVDCQPHLISISSEKSHNTNKGIRENRTFSVNIPSASMAAATDYCGMYSGSKVDKSKAFSVFYGDLKTAPMISECPINIECRLTQTIELFHGELFIGEIVGVFTESKYLTDGKPDIRKIDPLIFENGAPPYYWKLGERIAKAFEIGKDYKPHPEE